MMQVEAAHCRTQVDLPLDGQYIVPGTHFSELSPHFLNTVVVNKKDMKSMKVPRVQRKSAERIDMLWIYNPHLISMYV